ncbi:MAG: fused MFS/spermidine synthase [Firmicutes bacterium]|nr:fused MFS/spermidine synthase [Bacillota bacterium]
MLAYYLMAFLCGGFTMTLELVASRLVAPVLGVSLYTWTSVIGAVLAGMSAGSFAGGWLADRRDPRQILGPILVVSGIAVALIVPILPALHLAIPFLKAPLLRVALPILAVFGIPCFAIGLVSPVLYRICLNDPARTGSTVGRLAASGSLGSIAGTFATGFWLIPAFGTRAIVLGVSGGLLFLGVLAMTWKSRRERAVALVLVAAVAVGSLAGLNRFVRDGNVIESAYYRIKIATSVHPVGGIVKQLILDNLIHSAANPDNPDFLWYEYERVSAWVIRNWAPENVRALFVGGGGYTLPYWVERRYPKGAVEVVEIDPEVTKIALSQFIVNPTKIVSLNEDGRTAVNNLPPGKKYDLIFGDAFNDLSVPYHLTTKEFAGLLRAHLSDNGVYVANIIDTAGGGFLDAFTTTLSQVFPHIWIVAGSASAAHGVRSPHLVLASASPLPVDKWTAPEDVDFAVNPREPKNKGLVLTDDHAPVDNLLLPLFAAKLGI